jgi:hypothetical protein
MSSHSNDQIISYGIIKIDEPVVVEPVAPPEAIEITDEPIVCSSVPDDDFAPVLMDVHEPAPLLDDCVEYNLYILKEMMRVSKQSYETYTPFEYMKDGNKYCFRVQVDGDKLVDVKGKYAFGKASNVTVEPATTGQPLTS